ncbi:glycoside hydrolase family 17 protein [Novispirillum itersonii]|uniref:glycoside hydrolase family 17 protein n=1 Tax=Novispirillum itersonii TaxID=189 RepID=UPI0003604E6D|nr:hypothetical protein [Novispirillum itersonii]
MIGRGVVAAVLAVCAAVALGSWVRLGQPVAVPDAPVTRAQCVSYAPFRGEETPFDKTFSVSEQRLEEDLRHLSAFTPCVRTYATTNGLDKVAAVAERLGMTVLQGLWIGAEDAANRKELEKVVELAHAYPKTITGVIVGNEVLLRREQAADRLAVYIREVNDRVEQPVTYADVWEFWRRHGAALKDAVDFITIHLLPYWEDDPSDISEALVHVKQIHDQMAAEFPGKEILVGEIGWPSTGRQREAAEASLVNETRFIRGVLQMTAAEGWRANLIEATDQPWKRQLEGTTGGFWGVLGEGGTPKITLAGPVVEIADWQRWLLASVAVGLGITLLAGLTGGPRADATGWTISVTGGLAAGVLVVFCARHALFAARSPLEWGEHAASIGLAVLGPAMLLSLLRQQQPVQQQLGQQHPVGTAIAGWLYRLTLFSASVTAIGLAFGGRYRDFPATAILGVAVAVVLLMLARRSTAVLPERPEDRWLALITAAMALGVVGLETVKNDDALAWAGSALLLAAPALLRCRSSLSR